MLLDSHKKKGFTLKTIKERLDMAYSLRMTQDLDAVFLEDDARPGWLMKMINNDKVALLEELLLSDPRLKVKKMGKITKLSDTFVCRVLHDYSSM